MNINSSLEQDLINYCQTHDSYLFETNLYLPLKYLAASICQRMKLSKKEYQDGLIDDMVSTCAIKLPEVFDIKKGKAKSMAFIIMSQYILQLKQYNKKQKRDSKKTIYLEDMESDLALVYEIQIDEFQLMKNSLLENKALFESIKSKVDKRIALKIIDIIENPDNYQSYFNSYTVEIAKCCNTKALRVYKVIKTMKQMMVDSDILIKS